jgi:hypothetical protein
MKFTILALALSGALAAPVAEESPKAGTMAPPSIEARDLSWGVSFKTYQDYNCQAPLTGNTYDGSIWSVKTQGFDGSAKCICAYPEGSTNAICSADGLYDGGAALQSGWCFMNAGGVEAISCWGA